MRSTRQVWMCVLALVLASSLAAQPKYRSPYDLAMSPDGKTLYCSDRTAQCVVLFDTATGKVAGEIALTGAPSGLVLSPDGKTLYVAENGAGTVAVIDAAGKKVTARIPVARHPLGLALGPKTNRLYVCNTISDDVSVVDTTSNKEIKRIPVVREPMFAALTPDEKTLVVANSLPVGSADDFRLGASLSLIDTAAQKVVKNIALSSGATNAHSVCVSPDGKYAYVVHTVSRFMVPTTQLERGWMNTHGLSVVDLTKGERVVTVLLDHLNEGGADPLDMAMTKDGKRLCISLGGVHQIAFVEISGLHDMLGGKIPDKLREKKPYDMGSQNLWADVDKSEKSREGLTNDLTAMYVAGLLNRVPSGGNGPRGVALSPDEKTLWVAHYYSGDIAVLDTEKTKALAKHAVGEQPKADMVRLGEQIFHDASVCFQHWQSCATCHPSGRMDGLRWDLLNDGIGNPKKTRSLCMSHKTAPVMSLGVRATMEVGAAAGFKHILFVVVPESDIEAVCEYIRSLKPVPSPHLGPDGKLTEAAQRGKKVFDEKGGCIACHTGELLTDMKSYDVGTQGELDREAKEFYTPKLLELYRTAPFLHDGRAATIEEVFTKYNKDDRHGETSKLTKEELGDLVAYLLSL
ncbi:MAG: beta-propeller fold lactonase family protein [Planctomycetota bacterium]